MPSIDQIGFIETVRTAQASLEDLPTPESSVVVVPIALRVLADQLTPVLAYRRLVSSDQRTAPSFLLESVEGGDQQGRYSILAAHPMIELIAQGNQTTVTCHRGDRSLANEGTTTEQDPLETLRNLSANWELVIPEFSSNQNLLPHCVLGGWFGYAGYDSVRYAEPKKLAFDLAPKDDRNLPEVSFGFYDELVVFDHVDKLVYLVKLVFVTKQDDPTTQYTNAIRELEKLASSVQEHSKPLPLGRVVSKGKTKSNEPMPCNTSREDHASMIESAKEYIRKGDIFQVVLGHRFERRANADPFDVYRALRAVNPSPYMVYMQTRGSILVASSPEILCRVRRDEKQAERFVVTNRPLAGTRRRGRTPEDDHAMEKDLLADPKEISEHSMLVDLGRNDVGVVAEPGTIDLSKLMNIERYSHVMHISSTVTGTIREGLDCWDALRAALPVGTISGAPKIRAMQIIDELEHVRRGPYGGGLGWVSLDQEMDIALALRTMVVPIDRYDESNPEGRWEYHIQAAGGIVADSVPELEFKETVNKAAALGAAIDLAIDAFE
ncbi:MAG: anthranilate synthase component I [Phycisphaerales bacterium]|nr:anthranilate synthase component I [Phycisphaerales bacterium]